MLERDEVARAPVVSFLHISIRVHIVSKYYLTLAVINGFLSSIRGLILQESEDLYYELKANEDDWMIAGRRKGFISLPPSVGSRIVLSMACVPLVAGHVHPPALRLVNIGRAHVSRSPAGPHLVCILPPAPCTALCIRKGI